MVWLETSCSVRVNLLYCLICGKKKIDFPKVSSYLTIQYKGKKYFGQILIRCVDACEGLIVCCTQHLDFCLHMFFPHLTHCSFKLDV